jgi:modification methylase
MTDINEFIGKVIQGDCLEIMKTMPDNSVDLIVFSPPYNKHSAKRKPHHTDTWSGGNAGIKYTTTNDDMPEYEYQDWQIKIINECIRILKPYGSFFYNHKNRTLNKAIITPYEWILRTNAIIKQEIIWNRKMIVEVDKVRFYPKTERLFWLIKSRIQPKFNGDMAKLTEIWDISPCQKEKRNNHPAPYPEELVNNCIEATTKENDIVLDCFLGSGTTAVASQILGRRWIGIEISPEYCEIARKRLKPYLEQTSLKSEISKLKEVRE